MANFVANTAVDMTKLSDFALLSDWSQLKVPNTVIGASSIQVSSGPVKLNIGGTGLTVLGDDPSGGWYTSVQARENGAQVYKVSDINYAFWKIESNFSGSFQKNLFQYSDTINGSGQNDILYGYNGVDTITGKGGNDQIVGGKAGDLLYGKKGIDTIQGDNGNDLIDGGPGLNTVAGGKGADSFQFTAAVNGLNAAFITDFSKSDGDEIDLAKSAFAGIGHTNQALNANKFVVGPVATTPDQHIVYNKTIGAIYYDPDGSGAQAQTLFATVTANTNLKAGDFFVI